MIIDAKPELHIPIYAYSWRPYANPNNIYYQKDADRGIYFIIDPWTQRWLIGDTTLVTFLKAMTGKQRFSAILREFHERNDLKHPRGGFLQVAEYLINEKMIFNNKLEHKQSGYPVYNKTELTGFHLEITNACNMTCEHCYVSSGRKLPGELTLEQFKKAIDYLEPFSGKRIAISGGEPVASKDCAAILQYCIDCGHDVDLYTNGKKFPSKISELILSVNQRGLNTIRVQLSLEGSTAETNDKVRGPGSFNYAIETLGNFKTIGLSRHVVIFICLTKNNIHQVDDMIKLAEDYDVEMLVFSQWQKQGNAKDTSWASIAPTWQQWVSVGEKLLAYHNPRLRVTGNFYGDLNNNQIGRFSLDSPIFPKHLYAYNAFPRVTPEGDILADQLWVDPDWFLGNVKDNSFDDCFDSPKFYSQLKEMKDRVKHVEECNECRWKELCQCGSPGHTYAEYGHMNAKDLFCDSRKYWFEKYVDYHYAKKTASQVYGLE